MMNYESMVERARLRPDSTEAIAVIAMEQAHFQARENRKRKVKNFFKKFFGGKQEELITER